MSEESTRIVVLTEANGTFSCSVFAAHRSGLTARIVKYDANSAAKNISSLESQMIVPTLTMLGRSWCPCRRDAGIALLSPRGHYVVAGSGGHPDPLTLGVIFFTSCRCPL